MTDCIFCNILKGNIPSYKVYEDDFVFAFLDITQVTKGHTLIIPKEHVKDVFEWTPSIATHLATAIPKVANALQKAFPDMQGLNIVNNNKELAYQSVFHSHIHLIPRYTNEDDFALTMRSNMDDYTSDMMQEIAQNITNQF
ncbi:HIT domain-containing protein [Granulicatella sp. zg-ZJ]|uniref:HIT family protein n=1 Tax=Granulicatella sp. zg-ZJ TaxID=2678504 RepID=UPI0013D829CB|nr:HIT family protein [Granulicatella sp. zg-ZJ]MBS4749985.1 HIT family protein [Carnobacteriaceae bacterium zg-ZUI78]NEW63091.1 HIT domain-containing protein [Granulicatella sp. zg-ZJ]